MNPVGGHTMIVSNYTIQNRLHAYFQPAISATLTGFRWLAAIYHYGLSDALFGGTIWMISSNAANPQGASVTEIHFLSSYAPILSLQGRRRKITEGIIIQRMHWKDVAIDTNYRSVTLYHLWYTFRR